MAKQESGLARTARLLDLVPYLTTHQGIAISELAKTFNTTVKEITDDLNTLWMCGLPGYTPLELIDLEFESGFVSIRNAETLAAPRALDRAEALSIYMGLDLLGAELGGSNSSLVSEITNLQEQLRSQLISAPQVQIEASLASELRALIIRAIRRRGWLEITYHSAANDQVTKRQVAPYELSQSGSHEYLQGYCDSAKAIRNFRADRIVAVSEIADQLWPSNQVSGNDEAINYEVKVHVASRQVLEVLPQISANSSTATIQGYSAPWISRAILSLAGQVEAIAPTQIRAAVHARAMAALENYH
jgi:proteasome accessory factor C|uniref:helix-turn-helix transcriptional regulator n=1 Tax=Candidatus Planktophila sp. TaxID=2175601 RepID=UPI00404A1203